MAKRRSEWRPPKLLNILEQVWPVEEIADLANPDGDKLEGNCDTDKRRIELAKGIGAGAGEVFFHETLHALWYVTGLSRALAFALQRYGLPPAAASALVAEIDEMHSQAVGPALWAVLRRNRMRFDG